MNVLLFSSNSSADSCSSVNTATHCNRLQQTATDCNTLQHTATHCNTLQHTATSIKRDVPIGLGLQKQFHVKGRHVFFACSLLQCVVVCCSVLQCVEVCCIVLQCERASYLLCLQCVAVCCSVLQCDAVR